jgi:predicted transcriptional regulator of viral defense system
MDWIGILAEEARRSDLILADQLASKYAVGLKVISKALSRCERRGLVERVTHKIYVNKLATDFVPQDLVNVLRPNSYVSLESALHHWGVSTQSTALLTCVTKDKPRDFNGKSFAISYRSISLKLFSGFVEKRTRYSKYRIAEPEKALLDWVYLCLQEGFAPSLDELNFQPIDRPKLLEYAKQYPNTVLNLLLPALALQPVAA